MMGAGVAGSSIFSRLAAVSDPIRCRALLALERDELTVFELCQVLQLPQSTVSRHLKVLSENGWVVARPDGTRRLYSAALNRTGESARRLWRIVGGEVASSTTAAQDLRRLEGVRSERRTRSKEFFATQAGQWAELRQRMFGRRFDLLALLALLENDWNVGDLGTGTGQLSESLAPFVRNVIAVDDSDAMLEAASTRLARFPNVQIRRGRLEALPIEDGELSVAVLGLVLHHLAHPGPALTEASRCLAQGGRLLVIDMLPHEREEYRREMGHVWLGFDADQLTSWADGSSLRLANFSPIPVEPDSTGPALFVAVLRKG